MVPPGFWFLAWAERLRLPLAAEPLELEPARLEPPVVAVRLESALGLLVESRRLVDLELAGIEQPASPALEPSAVESRYFAEESSKRLRSN